MNRRTQQALDHCDVILEAVVRTREALPELMRRSRFVARDGYPSSSMGGPGQRGAVSRPTETTALSKPMADPVSQAIRDLLKALERMAGDANNINGRRHVALDNPLPTYPPCGNCARFLPVSGDGRCDACYRYKRRTGQERPVEGEWTA